MFRIIRRAPWIALGAAAAYYLDSENGASRRERAIERCRELGSQLGASGGSTWQSVDEDAVASRADEPLAEETAAGVGASAAPAMAEEILRDSERRLADPAGTAEEHRSSAATVAPVDPSSPVATAAARRD